MASDFPEIQKIGGPAQLPDSRSTRPHRTGLRHFCANDQRICRQNGQVLRLKSAVLRPGSPAKSPVRLKTMSPQRLMVWRTSVPWCYRSVAWVSTRSCPQIPDRTRKIGKWPDGSPLRPRVQYIHPHFCGQNHGRSAAANRPSAPVRGLPWFQASLAPSAGPSLHIFLLSAISKVGNLDFRAEPCRPQAILRGRPRSMATDPASGAQAGARQSRQNSARFAACPGAAAPLAAEKPNEPEGCAKIGVWTCRHRNEARRSPLARLVCAPGLVGGRRAPRR